MNQVNWRHLLIVGIAFVAIVVLVNVAFSAMWGQTIHTGPYGNGPYGPGTMMGPWAWGGMGFFWIFPVIGFLCMLLFLGVMASMFFGSTTQSVPPSTGSHGSLPSIPNAQDACRQCGQPMAANWMACPYCGTARPPR